MYKEDPCSVAFTREAPQVPKDLAASHNQEDPQEVQYSGRQLYARQTQHHAAPTQQAEEVLQKLVERGAADDSHNP